ncbi:MAG: CAP domain-containing protein [Clostridia bacterium]|nr:CAP domain-containing protein [Clostridia bacterium]
MKKHSTILCLLLCLTILCSCSAPLETPTPSAPTDSEVPVSSADSTTTTTDEAASSTDSSAADSTTTATSSGDPTTSGTSKDNSTTSARTSTTKRTDSSSTTKPTSTTTSSAKPNGSKYAVSLTVDTMPNKTKYHTGDTGDSLDTTGLVLKISFNDGSSEKVTSGYQTYGFYAKTPGTKTITVAYKRGESTLTCTYNVTVEKKTHNTPNISGTYHADKANAVLKMLNEARKSAGISELKMDTGNLMNAAKIRAKEITIDWAHERPDHDSWYTVFDEENADYAARGENLAKGHTSAESVFEGWKNSPVHNENMMSADFTHVSIACLEYNSQLYWVQLFGG